MDDLEQGQRGDVDQLKYKVGDIFDNLAISYGKRENQEHVAVSVGSS